jgi:hypothetical protein
MKQIKCKLCGEACNPEAPAGYAHDAGVPGVNPYTFRRAWMHVDCIQDALDTLRGQEPSEQRFENRYEEYCVKFAG